MKFDPEKHRRRSIRLKRYNYAGNNAYFVTICAYQKECLFGMISNGQMNLNVFGECVKKAWLETAEKRSNVRLDGFVIMPNHFHGILWLTRRDTACRVPLARRTPEIYDDYKHRGTSPYGGTAYEQFGKPVPGSLPTILRSFKSAATKLINENRNTPGVPAWQRNYYEHIIRSHKELRQISEYIQFNPVDWHNDEENPVNF